MPKCVGLSSLIDTAGRKDLGWTYNVVVNIDEAISVDHDVVCPSKSFLPAVSVEDLCHLSMQGEMMLVHQLLVAEPVFPLDLQLGKTPRSVERPRLR